MFYHAPPCHNDHVSGLQQHGCITKEWSIHPILLHCYHRSSLPRHVMAPILHFYDIPLNYTLHLIVPELLRCLVFDKSKTDSPKHQINQCFLWHGMKKNIAFRVSSCPLSASHDPLPHHEIFWVHLPNHTSTAISSLPSTTSLAGPNQFL